MKYRKMVVDVLIAAMLLSVFASGCGKKDNSSVAPNSNEESTLKNEYNTESIIVLQKDEAVNVGGKELLLTIRPEFEEDEGGIAVFNYDGNSFESEHCTEWPGSSYVIDYGEGNFAILYELCFSNDYVETEYIKHNSNDGFLSLGTTTGVVASDCDIDLSNNMVTLERRENIFGTYASRITFVMGDKKLDPIEDAIYFINEAQVDDGSFLDDYEENYDDFLSVYDENGRQVLTLSQELSVVYDSGEREILVPRSQIYPVGYNPDENKFYVEIAGKRAYFFYEYDEENYSYSINGINEYDMFEFLNYVG